MKRLKKGYTLIEIMFCLSSFIVLIGGVFTLYGKINTHVFSQSNENNYIFNENYNYLELNSRFLSGKKIKFSKEEIKIGTEILEIRENKLYLNDDLLIENLGGIEFECENNLIRIKIGGKIWCFAGLNVEILQ